MLLRVAVVACNVLAACIVLAVAGCGGKKEAAATTTGGDLPPGCTFEEAKTLVADFLARPDFAPASTFQLYASYETDGRRFVARKRAAALAQIRLRTSRFHERRRLVALLVAPQDFNTARIRLDITRQADDFRARGITNRISSGAGTIDCAHQQVAAWVQKGP